MPNLAKSAEKVQEVLDSHGLDLEVRELDKSTRTAKDAASTLDCEVAQIAKSLIFKSADTEKPILVIASGINRVNEAKIASYLQESKIVRADADFVRSATGFAIGGVPPVGHVEPLRTFIDEDLFQYKQLWAAAGTPRSVFSLTPKELVQITEGDVVNVSD